MGKCRRRQMRIRHLIRKNSLDRALHWYVLETLESLILHLSHYPWFVGHSGATKIYSTLRRNNYWPGIARDILHAVRDCNTSILTRGSCKCHHKILKLVSAVSPLVLVAIKILETFTKSTKSHHYILVSTARFSKFCRPFLLKSTTAATVAWGFQKK